MLESGEAGWLHPAHPRAEGTHVPPRIRPTGLRAALGAVTFAALVAACTHPIERVHPSSPATDTGSPTASPPTITPSVTPSVTPTLTAEPLTGHQAADAEILAQRAMDPVTGTQAVFDLLTLSGIPILSADIGAVVNDPGRPTNLEPYADAQARPTYIDAYVYDFMVRMLADALQHGRIWFPEDVWDLPDFLLPLLDQPLTGPDAFADAIPRWVEAGFTEPDDPAAFPALMVRALSRAHRPPNDVFRDIDPNSYRIDPVQFAIIGASLLSHVGVVLPSPASADGCQTPVRRRAAQDVNPKLLLSAKGDGPSRIVHSAYTEHDLFEVSGDIMADLLLLAGIDLRISDDVGGHTHVPLDFNDPARFVTIRSDLRWVSDAAGMTIRCGGLAGITLPSNGPLEGWAVGWNIQQSQDFVHAAGPDNGAKVTGLDGSGEGRPEPTDADGHTTLRLALRPEEGCPDTPVCGEGTLKTDPVSIFGFIDIERAKGFESLLPAFDRLTGPQGDLARNWLAAAVHEIDPPVGIDLLEVVSHHRD